MQKQTNKNLQKSSNVSKMNRQYKKPSKVVFQDFDYFDTQIYSESLDRSFLDNLELIEFDK